MKNGGVDVVDVYRMMDGVHAKIVGAAVTEASLYPAASEPKSEASVMMTAANLHLTVG